MMGDDFNDLPLMLRSAISVCPADTCEDVKAFCDIITQHNGGRGAVENALNYCLPIKESMSKHCSPILILSVELILLCSLLALSACGKSKLDIQTNQ
jgi:hypothetical protein